jgi:hypothetical protein
MLVQVQQQLTSVFQHGQAILWLDNKPTQCNIFMANNHFNGNKLCNGNF